MARSRRTVSWWLETDWTCPLCLHGHAWGTAVRCVGCDDEVCAACIVTVWSRQRGRAPRNARAHAAKDEPLCSACGAGAAEAG